MQKIGNMGEDLVNFFRSRLQHDGLVRTSYRSGKEALALSYAYPQSLYRGNKNKHLFENVRTYCMFIGYPFSGHSLVGSLLDAHPNAIIAHELEVFRFIGKGFGREQIFSMLLENSQDARKRGRTQSGYPYDVPHQWQGKYKKLEVIGDKRGDGATRRLFFRPELYDELHNTVGVDIKMVHVIRNPYDNITQMANVGRRNLSQVNEMDFRNAIERYFFKAKQNLALKEKYGEDIFDIKQEDLIAKPHKKISEMCKFFDLEENDDYINDCASIIYESPHKRRFKWEWTQELIEMVEYKMANIPFLSDYSYES